MRFLESFKRVKEDGEREDDLYYVDQAKAFRAPYASICRCRLWWVKMSQHVKIGPPTSLEALEPQWF